MPSRPRQGDRLRVDAEADGPVVASVSMLRVCRVLGGQPLLCGYSLITRCQYFVWMAT